MAIAPQFQNYNQPSYGQQYGGQQQQFNPVSNLQAPGADNDFFDSISQFLFGSPESYNQFQRFNPQQQDVLSQLLSGGQQNMQNPYEGFEPLRQETMNDFYQNILPNIKRQFTNSGAGAQSSPDFQGQLAAGGSGLSALLNAQKARYGQQNKQFGLQQQQLGLQPQFDIQRRERSPGFAQGITGSVGENMGNIAKLLPFLL